MQLPDRYRAVFLLGPERVEVREVPLPTPSHGELLLRVDAATTCGTDLKVFRRGGHPRMLKTPTPFGHEVAGTIVAAGSDAGIWKTGQRVVVGNSVPCGQCRYCRQERENLCHDLEYLNGAFAEYLLIPRAFATSNTHAIPAHMPAERAALTEPLACVLHGIYVCRLAGATETLVLGAGPIGLLFVAVLAAEGHPVVVADPNPSRLEVALQLGARATELVERNGIPGAPEAGDADFDLTVDATGSIRGWHEAIRRVRPGGQALLFGGCPPGERLEVDAGRIHYDEITVRGAYHHRPAAMSRALELLDREYLHLELLLSERRPLTQTEDALRSMMQRRSLKVVLEPRSAQPGREK